MGKRRWFRPQVFLGLLVGLASWLFQVGPAGRAFEQKGLDLLFMLRGGGPVPEELVIVAIDEPSFQDLGLQWPWPRSLHARLIDRLRAAGARVIAFDVIFAEPSAPKEDTALASALRRAGNVVLASDLRVVETSTIRQTLTVAPLPDFERAAAAVGIVNLARDSDAVIRAAHLSIAGAPSFARAVAQAAGWRGPPPAQSLLINYLGPSPAIRTLSYVDAVTPGEMSDDTFRGKIVLVGRAVGPAGRPVDDAHFTPYSWKGQLTPGVEIHASIVDTLLRGRPVEPAGALLKLLWAVGWSLAAAAAVVALSPRAGLGATVALVGAESGLALGAFGAARIWLPWVVPALGTIGVYGGTLALRWRESEREKAFIRRAFTRYVHPAVVREILANPDKLRLGGESVESTILFSDLEGFARVGERFSPVELVTFLNEYFSAMTEIALAHRGMLSQTLGDGILALWGVPVANPAHPLDACRTALLMQRRLVSLNEGWVAGGRPALRMRIGLQTGQIVVGNIGSAERFNYSAVGDNVNLASRLEGLNKLYRTSIIVGEATAARIGDAVALRELDLIRVVGRAEPVRIYECAAERGQLAEDRQELLEIFAKGLEAYRIQDWVRALEYFERALALAPADGPGQLYVERVRRFLAEPPPRDWDGVYTAATKEG